MRRLKNILLFLLLGAMALHAQDKPAAPQQPAKPAAPQAKSGAVAWHEKAATARIRFTVFSKRSPVVFVQSLKSSRTAFMPFSWKMGP